MRWVAYTLSACLLISGPGCVMVDSRVSELKPAQVPITAFVGRYENWAAYVTSKFGLTASSHLQDSIGFMYADWPGVAGAWIDLSIPEESSILITVRNSDGLIIHEKQLHENRDYKFIDGVIYFSKDFGAEGGHDSIAVTAGGGSLRWALDQERNLVVLTTAGGVGLIGLIPFGMVARTMAIHHRFKTQ